MGGNSAAAEFPAWGGTDAGFKPVIEGGEVVWRGREEEEGKEERAAGWRGMLTVMMRSVDCGTRRIRVRRITVVVGGVEGVVVVALRLRIGVDGLIFW